MFDWELLAMQASGLSRSLDEVLPRPEDENEHAKASDDGAGAMPGEGAGEMYDDRGATRGTEPGALEAQGSHPYQTRGAVGAGRF